MNFARSGICKGLNKIGDSKKENINVASTTSIKNLHRNGLRRSKSFSDLSNIQKLQQFKSKLPIKAVHETIPEEQVSTHVKSETVTKKGPVPTKLRPSTSLSDLQSLKPFVKPGINALRAIPHFKHSSQGSNNKVGEKRPVPASIIKPPPIKRTKPGVCQATSKTTLDKAVSKGPAKPKNPPSYDYKARFNILQEKHKALRDAHEKIKIEHKQMKEDNEKLVDMEKEVHRLNNIVVDLENLRSKHNKLKDAHEVLTTNFDTINQNYVILKEKHELLQEDYRTSEEENQLLLERNKIVSNELECVKNELCANEEERKSLHNTLQDMKGNIRVFCRVRPALLAEKANTLCKINYIDESNIELMKTKENMRHEFSFNRIFPPQATQTEVFTDLAQLVQSALDGYHVCVFAYGQTGSGKTYSMQGEEFDSNSDLSNSLTPPDVLPNSAGMIPRSLHLLYNKIKKMENIGWKYTLQCSFLEIYNESVRDLLDQNSKNLDIRYNEGKGVTVTNLTTESITSFEDFKRYMLIAQNNRAVAVTNFNEHSSRSHAVTKIYINGINEDFNFIHTGSINFVDLAGSESAKTSAGERLTETKNINKSLSALRSVIIALQNKENHIPYRNSKLTYLLQSCLGGNSKTLMLVNISPFEECINETMSSLRFAATVKEVKLNVCRSKTYLSTEAL